MQFMLQLRQFCCRVCWRKPESPKKHQLSTLHFDTLRGISCLSLPLTVGCFGLSLYPSLSLQPTKNTHFCRGNIFTASQLTPFTVHRCFTGEKSISRPHINLIYRAIPGEYLKQDQL